MKRSVKEPSDWQLRRDALEQDLFTVQAMAEKERRSAGQVSEAT